MALHKILIALSGVCLLNLTANAQERITIDDYTKRVLEYNHQLKSAFTSSEASYEASRAANSARFPKLSAAGDYTQQFKAQEIDFGGSNIKMKSNAYSLSANAAQTIYGGGVLTNQYRISKINYDISQLGFEQTLNTIVYTSEINYWNLAANYELLTVSREYVQIITALHELVKRRFDEGLISRTDVLMVDTRLKEAQLQLSKSVAVYKIALQNFNILMGNPVNARHAAVDSIQSPMPSQTFITLDSALTNRPEYQIAQKIIDAQAYNIKLARSKYNPQVVMGVQGSWGTQMLNFNGDTKLLGAAYLKLSVPIFSWNQRRYDVRANKAVLKSKENDLLNVRDQVDLELNNAITQIQETEKQVEIAKENHKIAIENLELNTFSYNEGKITILDVLSAQLSWLHSYTNTVTAHFSNKASIADYKRVIGAASTKVMR